MAVLFLLVVNFLTGNTDVGDQVFGFLALRCRTSVSISGRLLSALMVACRLGGLPDGPGPVYRL